MTLLKNPENLGNAHTDTFASANHTYVGGHSQVMRSVERAISDIAPTNIPVVLVGDSGTGKEVIAHHMHRLSHRRAEPFLKVMCAGLGPDHFDPARVLPGASNGATHPGTVFLDEISELDAVCQSRLLHALSEEGFTKESRWASARVISASSRNLEEEIRAGRFREDLYYRLAGLCLRLPPLRQRKEDIRILVDHFLTKHAALLGRPRLSLSAEAYATLTEFAWPGNVRELEHVVRNIVAMGDAVLVLGDLGLPLGEVRTTVPRSPVVSLKEAARAASRQAERELILKVLAQTRWNRKRAAQELQISYKALLYKLKQLELEDSGAV